MSKTILDETVNRFLCWKLPHDFAPDCGITFTPFHPNGTTRFEPVGTNLLTATQARAMLEHVIGAELTQLRIELRIKTEEHTCCAEDLIQLRAEIAVLKLSYDECYLAKMNLKRELAASKEGL